MVEQEDKVARWQKESQRTAYGSISSWPIRLTDRGCFARSQRTDGLGNSWQQIGWSVNTASMPNKRGISIKKL